MKYRTNKLNGDKLSVLGLGCMRFPRDETETEKIILRTIEKGVNYFDTAYIYPKSEDILGRILDRNGKRGEVKIATKMPPYFVNKHSDLDKIFNEQLRRLRTDYVDYYLIHMLTELSVWDRLKKLGVEQWIKEKKESGKIRSIGFSYHGGRDEFPKICDAYPWEFCMIQYNYLDENNQAGRSGLEHAAAKGIPVMIMEPLRGGMLANRLPPGVIKAFEEAKIKRSPAEWSLKWLWNHPEITCVLSGMGNLEMLEENSVSAAESEAGGFSQEDLDVITSVKNAFNETILVPCTSCGYCMPCPQGVDIPVCFSSYNTFGIGGRIASLKSYVMQAGFKSKPSLASLCNRCGACEKRCPQNIAIRDELQKTKKKLEKFYFKAFVFAARRFMKLNKKPTSDETQQ